MFLTSSLGASRGGRDGARRFTEPTVGPQLIAPTVSTDILKPTSDPVSHASLTRANRVALGIGLGLLFAGMLVVPSEPFTPLAGRTLGILGFVVVLWATGTLNATLVALIMMVLWPLAGVLSFEASIGGFGNPTVWLMIGILLISAAFNATGLDQRIAYRLLYLAKGRTRLTVLWTIVTLLVLTFLVPTGVGRAGVMLPIAEGMMRAIRLERGANVGKAIFLSAALVSLQSGGALMTGSAATLYAGGVFEQLAGHRWTYLSWLLLALPSVFLISLLACPIVLRLFPPEVEILEGGREYLRRQIADQGPMSARERKVAILFALMVGGWMTAPWHGLETGQVCLAVMLLMFLPPWSPLGFEDGLRSVSWSTVVLFGASLSLALALDRSGVTGVLVNRVEGLAVREWPPIGVGLLTMVTVAGLRLGFPNTIAMIATVLPASIVVATSLDINPVWLGMLAVLSSQILVVPLQSPTTMTLYSAGYFDVGEMLRSGILIAVVMITVTLLFAQFYWPLVGVPARL